MINKLCKKHANETIAVVIPEPLASLVAHKLKATDLQDVWKTEQDNGSWEMIDSDSHDSILSVGLRTSNATVSASSGLDRVDVASSLELSSSQAPSISRRL